MHNQDLIMLLCQDNAISFSGAARIAEKFRKRSIFKSDMILCQGSVSNESLFLDTGLIRSFYNDSQGNEITTNFYSNGDLVYEPTSLFMRIPSSENLQALTESVVWYINYDDLNHLFHTLPEYREFGRKNLVKEFTEIKARMLKMATKSAEERYADLLKNKPEIFKYASLKTIASYLGITDTSLSRIRKEFSKK